MDVISHLTQQQADQIPIYIEKWKSMCSLTTPIERGPFEAGLRAVHNEIKIEAPQEFLYFLSPAAMWREFESWKAKITSVGTQYWSYQIPLCDPYSMHRLWRPGSTRPAFNFAARRYSPGLGYALCETDDSNETWGTVINKEFHSELWKGFEFSLPFDWGLLSYYTFEEDGPIDEYLWERAHKEDETSQVGYQQCCFLAPEKWLLWELACVDFCHNVLGVERNGKLYRGLEAVVKYGSFCGTFGRLCVVCERPQSIEVDENGFTLNYRDGEFFSWQHE